MKMIVDEFSFASSSNLLNLDESFHKIKQVHEKYGRENGTLCHLIKAYLGHEMTEDDFDLMNIDGFWV